MSQQAIHLAQEGFALPSILLMIVLLSLMAVSVLSLGLFLRRSAVTEITRVKSEYAAESGIAKALAEAGSWSEISKILTGYSLHFEFAEDSRADVALDPWGMYIRAHSEGSSHQLKTTVTALACGHPPSAFDNALILANQTHQLVLTGSSGILGNVVTGQPGVMVGNLNKYGTPIQIPIKGKVTRTQDPELAPFDSLLLASEVRAYQGLLAGMVKEGGPDPCVLKVGSGADIVVGTTTLADSLDYLFVRGNATIEAQISRSQKPLFVIVQGNVFLQSLFSASGLVCIISSGAITVGKDVKLDEAILYSMRSIELRESASISAQLVAPSILIKEGAIAHYPSSIVSTIAGLSDSTKQTILISDGARVEGFVALYSRGVRGQSNRLITVRPTATVLGLIYCEGVVTLDGSVYGTVMTRDFYFYETPTAYIGWLRSGRIDRTRLPPGYLVPPGFSANRELDVLDWL